MSPALNKRPFEAYRGQAQYIFVSYAHRDSDAVYPELARLKKLGFNVWYDEGISPGSHWSDELAERINNCALFLFMVTPRSVTSRNCLDEANYVLNSDTPFLAIHLEETTLPPGLDLRMGSRQAILRYELEELSFESKLYAAVAAHAATRGQPMTDVAQGFYLGPYKVETLRGAVTGPDDETHHLEPKVMDVFTCLARRPNELVTRDALLATVWTGQVAADELLTRAVSELRRVLGGAKFIETVPKRGYRLVGDVQPIDDAEPESTEEIIWPVTTAFRHKSTYAALGVVVLAIAIFALGSDFSRVIREPASEIDQSSRYTIAVLPFENLSGDPEQEYFVDGIHDEVIARLAKIGALTVISRTSVMQYKEQRKPLPVIADELNVGQVVEGTVRRSGNTVRVTVQLIDAPKDHHVWSESYSEELTDILALQSDLASAIVAQIQIQMTPQEQRTLADVRPVVKEAYEAYLKARYYLNKALDWRDTNTAIEYLEQSIAVDPTFAPAYATLVTAYERVLAFGHADPEAGEWIAKARARASTAIELDDTLAETFVARGLVEKMEWNWRAAWDDFEQAIQLNPNLRTARSAFALLLNDLGYLDAALLQIMKAHQLDPVSSIVNQQMGWIYINRAEYVKAIDQFNLVEELQPDTFITKHNRLYVYFDAGMYDTLLEAIAMDDGCRAKYFRALAYAMTDRNKAAREIHKDYEDGCNLEEDAMDAATLIHIIYEDEELALDWLERSYERREGHFTYILFPFFDSLRDNPRYMALMRKSGLAELAKPYSETHKRTTLR